MRGARTRRNDARLYVLVALVALFTCVVAGIFIRQHTPRAHDEFAYLLQGETFAEFRLTNPTPPLPEFFEAPHVLLTPSYMGKYPPGQGLALAAGFWLGNPIFGVWLSTCAFAVATAWMVRGFFSRRWALLAALLVIAQFGFFHYWTQSFWGGALAAAGGALVFGGARRCWRSFRGGDAALLGLGVVILAFTRPLEGALACIVPGIVVLTAVLRPRGPAARNLHDRDRWRWRQGWPLIAVLLAGGAFLALYQQRVTGSPWRLPYAEYERQKSGAPIFVWQQERPEPAFQNPALRDFYRSYVLPLTEAKSTFLGHTGQRVADLLKNFLGPLLILAALAGLLRARRSWSLMALASVTIMASAVVVCRWYGLHYMAPAAPVLLFLAIAGVRALTLRFRRSAQRPRLVIAGVAVAQFGLALASANGVAQLGLLNAPTYRQKFDDTLRATGERYLVFVRLEPPYDPNLSWVYNHARLADSAVVWAWDRGAGENARLRAALPGREATLMTLRGQTIKFTALANSPTTR